MNEKPILFNGDMVRAALAGRKTQTRRLVKPQPHGEVPSSILPGWYEPLRVGRDGIEYPGSPVYGFASEEQGWTSPFGAPGSKLWVRETWRTITDDFGFGSVQYRADSAVHRLLTTDGDDGDPCGVSGQTSVEQWAPDDMPKWRPSIHMPRWACRLLLDVTDVRVERLQDISEDDAIAEGMTLELCQEIFDTVSKGQSADEAYYVRFEDDSDSDGYLCEKCALKLQAENSGSTLVPACCPEDDGPSMCDECHRPLLISLTEYGIDSELCLQNGPESREYWPAHDADAVIAHSIASGIGNLQERQIGRLMQIGFATLWDSIYSKPSPVYCRDGNGNCIVTNYESYPWGGASGTFEHNGKPHIVVANPWVWVCEFEKQKGTR